MLADNSKTKMYYFFLQDDIKHSKEQCNKENIDEVQEKTTTLTIFF